MRGLWRGERAWDTSLRGEGGEERGEERGVNTGWNGDRKMDTFTKYAFEPSKEWDRYEKRNDDIRQNI